MGNGIGHENGVACTMPWGIDYEINDEARKFNTLCGKLCSCFKGCPCGRPTAACCPCLVCSGDDDGECCCFVGTILTCWTGVPSVIVCCCYGPTDRPICCAGQSATHQDVDTQRAESSDQSTEVSRDRSTEAPNSTEPTHNSM